MLSDKINDGGPAFPCEGGVTSGLYAHPGMSLRDYLAAQAIAGWLSGTMSRPKGGFSWDSAAREAYGIADAMLAAREKGGDA